MELFGLNHKIGSTKSETLTDISEEDLKATFQERCKTFGKQPDTTYDINISKFNLNSASIGEKKCKGIELQDIHEAYQLLLKIVKARIMFSEKLEDLRGSQLPEIKEEKEKTKVKNVNKAASMFRKKKQ